VLTDQEQIRGVIYEYYKKMFGIQKKEQ
jgi:hypothetical protein